MYFVYARPYPLHIQVARKECATVCWLAGWFKLCYRHHTNISNFINFHSQLHPHFYSSTVPRTHIRKHAHTWRVQPAHTKITFNFKTSCSFFPLYFFRRKGVWRDLECKLFGITLKNINKIPSVRNRIETGQEKARERERETVTVAHKKAHTYREHKTDRITKVNERRVKEIECVYN